MTNSKGEGDLSPHVFIAIPTYSGKFATGCLASLAAAEALLRASGWDVTLSLVKGDCYVQRARNTLVARFMASGADSLLFIDDDVGFPPEAVQKLLGMSDDVVFGVYPLKHETEDYPVVIRTDDAGYPIVRADGCIAAVGAPTGFLRIKRSVIAALQAAHPELAYTDAPEGAPGTVFDLFPQGARDGRWWGEDFAFCNMWTGIGGEIWCVPDIDFTHTGETVFSGNYHRFLMRQPRAA